MKKNITLGVVCLARKTFDYEAAGSLYRELKDSLIKETEEVTWSFIDELVIEPEDARRAAICLEEAHIDGLMVISGTFHLGHLVLELNRILNKPLMLWGLPELPYNGGKIRLNSVCGLNLNASNLYKSGIRDFHYVVGDRPDGNWIDAVRVDKMMRESRIGLLGYRAKGFFNLGVYDLNVYRRMGMLVDHYEQDTLWNLETDDREVARRLEQLKDTFVTTAVSEEQLGKVAELAVKLDSFTEQEGLDALAIRCWPEFAAGYGIAPCASMSLIQSEGKILGCEGDLEGTISMMAQAAVGAETPYLFDFSQVDFEEDSALLWHCGVAPCNLWDGRCERSLSSYHAGGKGVTADFVLKDGHLSVLRFDSAGEEYRVFLSEADVIPMEKELAGTYMKARFGEPVRDVLDKVVRNGIAHHAAVSYGSYTEPFRILAKMKGWRVIE